MHDKYKLNFPVFGANIYRALIFASLLVLMFVENVLVKFSPGNCDFTQYQCALPTIDR